MRVLANQIINLKLPMGVGRADQSFGSGYPVSYTRNPTFQYSQYLQLLTIPKLKTFTRALLFSVVRGTGFEPVRCIIALLAFSDLTGLTLLCYIVYHSATLSICRLSGCQTFSLLGCLRVGMTSKLGLSDLAV